jgi:hypothetical protein
LVWGFTAVVETNCYPSSSRQEDQIKETQGKIEKKKGEIIQLQTAAQGQAAGGGQAVRA